MGGNIIRIGTLVSFLSYIFFSFCRGVAYKPLLSIDQILEDIESFLASSEPIYFDAEKKLDAYSEYERELLNLGIVVDEAKGAPVKPQFEVVEVNDDIKIACSDDKTGGESPCMEIVPYVDAFRREWELASSNAKDCRRKIKKNSNTKLPSPYSSCRLFYTHRDAYNTLRDTYLETLGQQHVGTDDDSRFHRALASLVQFIREQTTKNKQRVKAIEYNVEKEDVNKDALDLVPAANKELAVRESLPLVSTKQNTHLKRAADDTQIGRDVEMSQTKRMKSDTFSFYTPSVVSIHFGAGGSGGGGDDGDDGDGPGEGNDDPKENCRNLEYYLDNFFFINYKPKESGFSTLPIYSAGLAMFALSLLM